MKKNIYTPKQKLFEATDRRDDLLLMKGLVGLTQSEELELKNLDVKILDYWSDWKEGQ